MMQICEASRVSRFMMRGILTAAALCVPAQSLFAVNCPVVKHGPPSDADKAMLAADYDKAAGLYKAALAKTPGDTDATVGLVHALLRQQLVPEADDAVKEALAAAPKSAAFVTLRGEVEFRQGQPWVVEPTVIESYKLDPCNPRTRLLYARVLEATSRYATAVQQIVLAHQFDPDDPEIRRMWIETLPLPMRIKELDAYLAAPSGDDKETIAQLHAELDRLKQRADEPEKTCHIASSSSTGEIPFIRLAGWAGHPRAYGLEIPMNGNATRLQIDTRGAGISIYRSAADRVGLKRLGTPAAGEKGSHTAYADSIRVGGLEFKDCAVNVIDSASPFDDGDGSIGMDIFSDFMITLDIPMRKLILGPLPARPAEPVAPTPRLHTIPSDLDDLEAVTESAKPAAGAAAAPAPTGPFDRFIAPEMKDYTQFYHVGHDLILPTVLNGDKIKLFIADTATDVAANISASAALDVAKVHEDKTMEHPGAGGKTEKVFVADEITFNFAHVSQKIANVSSTNTSAASKGDGMEVSGSLGMNMLILLTLHIDYRDGLLKADYVPGRGNPKME
jgi:hypothetical protein